MMQSNRIFCHVQVKWSLAEKLEWSGSVHWNAWRMLFLLAYWIRLMSRAWRLIVKTFPLIALTFFCRRKKRIADAFPLKGNLDRFVVSILIWVTGTLTLMKRPFDENPFSIYPKEKSSPHSPYSIWCLFFFALKTILNHIHFAFDVFSIQTAFSLHSIGKKMFCTAFHLNFGWRFAGETA